MIGNGTAAVGCIEGIRSVDPAGEIVVVSGEKHPAYGRPLISYYLENRTDLEHMQYREDGFYEKNGCRVIYGRRAVSLDPAGKSVTLDDGQTLLFRYDAKNRQAEYVKKVTVEDGTAAFTLAEGGDYFLAERALAGSLNDEETDAEQSVIRDETEKISLGMPEKSDETSADGLREPENIPGWAVPAAGGAAAAAVVAAAAVILHRKRKGQR